MSDAAERFLRTNPQLGALFDEAADRLARYFPGDSLAASLRRLDMEGGPEELVLAVTTDLSWDEAGARLERFDDEWWIDHVQESEGLVTIALDRA